MDVQAHYQTNSGDVIDSKEVNLPIRLFSKENYIDIENLYKPMDDAVKDPDMFFGRKDLIDQLAALVQNNESQCAVVFGQKRAGKSSILYHLQEKLRSDPSLLIVNLGNIGAIYDPDASISYLYLFLWEIVNEMKKEVDSFVRMGYPDLGVDFPSSFESFSSGGSSVNRFRELFDAFKARKRDHEQWKEVRVVLFIDEFTYIYEYIIKGTVDDSFMNRWKAFLERKYFSAVLAGQDTMPKMRRRFPNAFGIIKDFRVDYLAPEDAEDLIISPIKMPNGESRFRGRAIEHILDLTAGSPFYIQILCDRLVKYMNRERTPHVTQADINSIRDDLVYGLQALDLDRFENLYNSSDISQDAITDEDALEVLKKIAENSKTSPCNRKDIVCETQIPIDDILADLVTRLVLKKEGDHYQIRVGLFKWWLLANY